MAAWVVDLENPPIPETPQIKCMCGEPMINREGEMVCPQAPPVNIDPNP